MSNIERTERTYDLRRHLESSLILSHDTPKINPMHECYYLLPTSWLNSWSSFINSESPQPPPRIPLNYFLTLNGDLKPDLKPITHYRAVNSTQYHIFFNLYSADSSPPQIRSTVDLYSPELSNEKVKEYIKSGALKARVEVNRLLIQVREGGGIGGAEKFEREEVEEELFCWCVTRDFIEVRVCEERSDELKRRVYWISPLLITRTLRSSQRVIECLFRCGNKSGVKYKQVTEYDDETYEDEEDEEEGYEDEDIECFEEDIEMPTRRNIDK
jgi:hypothetical protein